MPPIEQRLGTELPLDTAHVLLDYPTDQLRRWAARHGMDAEALQNDLVREALQHAPAPQIMEMYQQAKYRAKTLSVVWFRGIPRPSSDGLRALIPIAPYRPLDLPSKQLAFVWANENDVRGEMRVRLAYRRQRSLAVQHGLGFVDHSPYGYITLLWRPTPSGEVIEVWTSWDRVSGVHDLLVEATQVDPRAIEVLDVTPNATNDALAEDLDAQLSFSKWRNEAPTDADTVAEEAAWANPGRSLREPGSSYVANGRGERESISRLLEWNAGGTKVTLKVSTRAYSIQLWPGTPTLTARVLQGALQHGTWRPFSEAPRPNQGVRPRGGH